MMDEIAMAGKPFILLSPDGDLPTNPMRLSKCLPSQSGSNSRKT
jgi:hypothetical protein